MLEQIIKLPAFSKVTFLVTTHSPFIISASADFPDQKTYLIKNGRTVDLAQNISAGAGYSGKKCITVAAQMVGAGLTDVMAQAKTNEKVTVVYCEGSDKACKDSLIYQQIFADEDNRYIFVSTGGFTQARVAYYNARTAAPFLFGENSAALVLLDRSKSGEGVFINSSLTVEATSNKKPIFTDDERKTIIGSDLQKGHRMLIRKEIENYLFDPALVRLLSEKKRNIWKDRVNPTVLDYTQGEIKDFLKASSRKLMPELAALLREHRSKETKHLYDELKACLEGTI